MANIVVVGGGILGLSGGMLLAGDGHQVTVLERDPEAPPAPEEAWTEWTRKGVNQFRLLHFFAAGFHEIARVDLPQVVQAMKDAGALQMNFIDGIPDDVTGGRRESGDAFTVGTPPPPGGGSAHPPARSAPPGLPLRS